MKPLIDRIAVVAGATRGAGRGIACMLGEAGATVYCTGRSVAGHPPAGGAYAGRPETIEQTAAMVGERGGVGHAARVDHGDAAQVAALATELDRQHGRVDILVLDFWGDDQPVPFGTPFWSIPIADGRQTIERTLWPHVIALQALVPLMRRPHTGGGPPRLVVEVGDGASLYYRTSLFFDLAAVLRARLAYAAAEELAPDGITVIGVSPGYLRSETSLDRFGVTEDTWRDAGTRDPAFLESETPFYLGRAIAAVAADPDSARWSGGLYGSWSLASAYGVRDVDGSAPDFGTYMARTYGESPGPLRTSTRWTVGARGPSNDRAPVSKEGA
jgi:NAD(P)-dependent dehydrogenase (short-subunit alcohol dehydrogenase family)